MSGKLITITIPKAIGNVILKKVNPEELSYAFETLSKNKDLI